MARPSLYLRKSQDLQYHAKHTREEMDKEVWRELMESKVMGESLGLQAEFIRMLDRFDLEEAVHWALKLQITDHQHLPGAVAIRLRDGNTREESPQEQVCDCWDLDEVDEKKVLSNEVIQGWSTSEKGWTAAEAEEDSTHFRLPFGRDGIVLVDTKQAFGDFLRYLNTKPSYLFGLDTEFMGTFGSNQQTATLIQISGKNCVHLLDVVRLLPVLAEADWSELVRAFFMDDNVRILGYSLGSGVAINSA